MNTKQVIVMRTKYPDGKGGVLSLRKGKLMAQAAHASMMWLSERLQKFLYQTVHLSKEEMEWLAGAFTKVVLQVDSEEALLEVYNKAKEARLTAFLVTDSGRTEFGGIPTKTCCAIGPHEDEKIDLITSHLKLY